MISAREALKKTKEASESIFKAMIKGVEEEIEDAITNGYCYCFWNGDLPEVVISTLIDLGYSVVKCGLTGEVKYKIEWGVTDDLFR